jgi:hypothetical protein
MREDKVSYTELKDSLPAPARHVVEEFLEANEPPEHVLRRLVREEGCDIYEAYGYVREVLSRALMELTGSSFSPSVEWEPVPVFDASRFKGRTLRDRIPAR